MKKRYRVYAVWGVLVLLGVGVYLLQSQERPPPISPEDQRRMFAFPEEEVGQVDILFRGQAASLIRSPKGLWLLHDAAHKHIPGQIPADAEGESSQTESSSPGSDGLESSGSVNEGSGSSGAGSRGLGSSVPGNNGPASPESEAGESRAGGSSDPAQGPSTAATAEPAADAAGLDEPHPEPNPAQAAELAKSVDFLVRMIFDRRINPTEELDEYGLDNPQIMIILYPRNADNSAGDTPLSMLFVGSPLSHNQSYYAQVNGDRDIALIPLYQVNMLTELAVGEVAQASLGQLELNPTNR